MKFAFEDFVLNTETSVLTQASEEIPLERRVFDLLLFLIENRERVLSKDEIVAHVWEGRFTSDSAISTSIKSLRKALQDNGSEQRFIRTQRGRGFRFIADVEILSSDTQHETNTSLLDSSDQATADQPFSLNGFLLPEQIKLNEQEQGKPSLIVLPFQSLIPDQEDLVFAEALAHELIQGLSRLRWLRVIARGTAFRFRMPVPDLAAIGRHLSVRYALSGSIDSIGHNRWAINVELANCESLDVIWAERFESKSDEIHDIRKQIMAQVISSLEIYIPLHEANQAALNISENLDSWANYHLGLRHMFRFTHADNQMASRYFHKAIELDPRFARAYGGLSFTRFQDAFIKYDSDTAKAITDARRYAETSVELDPLDPFTNFNMGRSYWLEGDPIGSQGWLDRSVSLSPNFAQGHYSIAFTEVMQGNADGALQDSEKALNISPLDPLIYAIYSVRGFGKLQCGEHEEAVYWADKGARAPGAHFLIPMIASVIHALSGNQQQAHFWRDRTKRLNPNADTDHFFAAFPFMDGEFRNLLTTGLAKAGF